MVTHRRIVPDGADFYNTPEWSTELFLEHEKFDGGIIEPACGSGYMSRVLEKYYPDKVFSCDLYDRGYGISGINFLTVPGELTVDNIITNPPFNLAEDFIRQGLKHARKKLALFLRLAFLEGQNRKSSIYDVCPPTRVWVHSKRVTMFPGDMANAPKRGGTCAYMWACWDKTVDQGYTELRWL